MRQKSASALCLFLLFLVFSAIGRSLCAADLSVTEVIKKAMPAVVHIFKYNKDGEELSSGTGFFIAPGKILTNAHVVKNAYSLFVSRTQVFKDPSSKTRIVLSSQVEYRQPTILKMGAEVDLALLAVADMDAPTISPEADSSIEVGESVVTIGNPEGFDNLASNGIVRGIYQNRNDFILSAPADPGYSGGPVLNMRGNVVGIWRAHNKERQLFGYAIGLTAILEFLKSPDHPSALPYAGSRMPETRRLWLRVLDSVYGAIRTAIKASAKFLWWLSMFFVRIAGTVILLILCPLILLLMVACAIKVVKKIAPVLVVLGALSLWVALVLFLPRWLNHFISDEKLVLPTIVTAILAGVILYLLSKRALKSLGATAKKGRETHKSFESRKREDLADVQMSRDTAPERPSIEAAKPEKAEKKTITAEGRLDRLERELHRLRRRSRWLVGAVVLCLAVVAVSWAFRPMSTKVQTDGALRKVVRANRFVLEDPNGKERAELTMSFGGPALFLHDENGNMRAELTVDKSGSWLAMFDENGKPRIALMENKEVSSLGLIDENGKPRVALMVDQKGPVLALYDKNGKRIPIR